MLLLRFCVFSWPSRCKLPKKIKNVLVLLMFFWCFCCHGFQISDASVTAALASNILKLRFLKLKIKWVKARMRC